MLFDGPARKAEEGYGKHEERYDDYDDDDDNDDDDGADDDNYDDDNDDDDDDVDDDQGTGCPNPSRKRLICARQRRADRH